MSARLDELIETLASQKKVVDQLVETIQSIRQEANDLPDELANSVIDYLQTRIKEAIGLEEEQSPKSNYERVVAFLRKKGVPQTLKEIVEGAGVPKGSLNLIIYKNHREEFESEKTGQGKTLAWKLRNGS